MRGSSLELIKNNHGIKAMRVKNFGLTWVSPGRLRILIIAGIVFANLFVIALSAHSLYQIRQQDELRARTLTQNMAQAVDQNRTASKEST